MIYQVELHRDEDRSAGLGHRFMSLVNKRINEIAQSPELHKKKKGNCREALVSVFPYVIIYEIFKKEKVVFISYIFHTKRNPRLKFRR